MTKILIATATTVLIALALCASLIAIETGPVSDFARAAFDTGLPAVMTLLASLVLMGLIARHPVLRRMPSL